MTSILFLLLLLSLIVNLAQLIHASSSAKQQRSADQKTIYRCQDIAMGCYRESIDQYRSGKDPKLFQRALGAMDVVAAIREKFPRV